jgi:hypothetical protein
MTAVALALEPICENELSASTNVRGCMRFAVHTQTCPNQPSRVRRRSATSNAHRLDASCLLDTCVTMDLSHVRITPREENACTRA